MHTVLQLALYGKSGKKILKLSFFTPDTLFDISVSKLTLADHAFSY